MSNQARKKVTDDDWEARKPMLEWLYLKKNKALVGEGGVEETMRREHNFFATTSQYERRFKVWKWSKNQKKEQWQQIEAVVQARAREGKETEVYRHGRLVPQERLRKETGRYRLPNYLRPAPILPQGFSIRSPVLDRTPSFTVDLPFRLFENLLRGLKRPSTIDPRLTVINDDDPAPDLDQPSHIPEGASVMRSQSSARPGIFDASPSETFPTIFASLKSVMPPAPVYTSADSALMDPATSSFSSQLLRQMLFSLANNFVGLRSFSSEQVIQYLQQETTETLYRLIRFAPSHSSKAIAHSIFRCALEAGHAGIVELLLSERTVGIDVNQGVSISHGKRNTPIQLASKHCHKEIIVVLLRHGADVNMSFENERRFSTGGALDHLMLSIHFPGTTVGRETFQILLKAGGDFQHIDSMGRLLEKDDGLFMLVLSENSQENHAKWSEWGLFLGAIERLNDFASNAMVDIMAGVGAHLNYDCRKRVFCFTWSRSPPRRIIDMAARHGKLEVVDNLLNHGAVLTGDTLSHAIMSGNENLITFLLDIGANVCGTESLHTTPLAEAIRLRSPRILSLIIEGGALDCVQDEKQLKYALRAASEIGDILTIEKLLRLGNKISPETLGSALVKALWFGHDEAAKTLIFAGAEVNKGPDRKSALYAALKRRNADLVYLLLDAGADPRYESEETALLAEAVRWGDHCVVEALLFAGAPCDPKMTPNKLGELPLVIAAERRDLELVKLLLHAGADLNSRLNIKKGNSRSTALATAARNGDIHMAQFLLRQGADPNDPDALTKAASTNSELFGNILDHYTARYPAGRRHFGSKILKNAIESGDLHVVKTVLEKGINSNGFIFDKKETWVEMTPFGYAITTKQSDRIQFIAMFLQAGCHPNEIISKPIHHSGFTALLAAVNTQEATVVELLIKNGADVNLVARGPIKRTPLQRASEIGSKEMMELLLSHGADVNSPAALKGGGTALQLAAIGGYIPIALALLNRRADVDAQPSRVDGRSALEGAAEHGRLDMVQLLLNAGAASKGKNETQIRKALSRASQNCHYAVCDLLETHLHKENVRHNLEVPNEGSIDEFFDWELGS